MIQSLPREDPHEKIALDRIFKKAVTSSNKWTTVPLAPCFAMIKTPATAAGV